MLELLLVVAAVGYVMKRAGQRQLDPTVWATLLFFGWLLLFGLSISGLGPIGLVLRAVWILGVVLFLEHGRVGSNELEEPWKCPDCLQYNDAVTLSCACGFDQVPRDDGSTTAISHTDGESSDSESASGS